jgi:RND family efflux transporter MFP subunit
MTMKSLALAPFVRAAGCALLLAHAAAALAQGQAANQAPADAPPDATPPAAATAPALTDNTVRALVVADMEATISSQIAGRLTSMPRQVGDTFATGDLLAAFDCQDRYAAEKAAQAELLGARETHLAKLKLQSLGAVSDLDVTLAAAAAEKARSQVMLAQVQQRQCVVHAPYPGKVVRMRAKAFESVQAGQPLLEIVNLASLRAQLLVPSSWLRWIKPGMPFQLRVEETGQTYNGRVHRISGRVDGSSQTVEVVGRFDRIPPNVLPGMIGTASFPERR